MPANTSRYSAKRPDRVFRVYVKSLDVLRNYERKSLYDGKS